MIPGLRSSAEGAMYERGQSAHKYIDRSAFLLAWLIGLFLTHILRTAQDPVSDSSLCFLLYMHSRLSTDMKEVVPFTADN